MQKTAIALAVSLVVAACGGTADEAGDSSAVPATTVATTTTTSSTTTTTAAPGGFPVTVEHATGTTTIGALPQSIVSMSATATEILFAIGAGDQVAAVDSQSDYPEAAPRIDLSAFEPSVEAVAALEPDLVVMSFDPGDIESGLQALDIPVIMQFPAASLEDAYSQIEQLGTATGNSAAAATLIGEIQSTIAELEETHGTRDEPLTYYHELDNTFYSVTSSTFIGELYSAAGPRQRGRSRRCRGLRLPAAFCRVHPRRRPRSDFPGRHQVLRAERRDPGRAPRLG